MPPTPFKRPKELNDAQEALDAAHELFLESQATADQDQTASVQAQQRASDSASEAQKALADRDASFDAYFKLATSVYRGGPAPAGGDRGANRAAVGKRG